MERCLENQWGATGSDSLISFCLWEAGHAFTDPGEWVAQGEQLPGGRPDADHVIFVSTAAVLWVEGGGDAARGVSTTSRSFVSALFWRARVRVLQVVLSTKWSIWSRFMRMLRVLHYCAAVTCLCCPAARTTASFPI